MNMLILSLRCSQSWIGIVLIAALFNLTMVNGLFFLNLFGRSPVPQFGSYPTSSANYDLPTVLDASNPEAFVVYPSQILDNQNTIKFPLLIFGHGYQAGDGKTSSFYKSLLEGVASFGFIVIAPRSCNDGCPPNYRFEMFKLLDWVAPSQFGNAPSEDTLGITQFINHDTGYGFFGHSMGGRATARNLHFVNTTQYAVWRFNTRNIDDQYPIRHIHRNQGFLLWRIGHKEIVQRCYWSKSLRQYDWSTSLGVNECFVGTE